jgi:hypothetical protein
MRLRLTLLLITLWLAGLSVPAQQPEQSQVHPATSLVLGTVYDSNRAVIVGARVVARDLFKHDFEATTDDAGVYHFELPHGVYRIEANAEGFCPKRIGDFRSFLGQLDFNLVIKESGRRCQQETMIKKASPDRLAQEQLRRITE